MLTHTVSQNGRPKNRLTCLSTKIIAQNNFSWTEGEKVSRIKHVRKKWIAAANALCQEFITPNNTFTYLSCLIQVNNFIKIFYTMGVGEF